MQGCGKPEGTAHPQRAVNADIATHQMRQSLGQREPETDPTVLAGDRGVGLLEDVEQPFHLVRSDADAGFLDLKAHPQLAADVFPSAWHLCLSFAGVDRTEPGAGAPRSHGGTALVSTSMRSPLSIAA